MKFKTPQEEFWAGEFGSEYINRNISGKYLASNVNFFSQIIQSCESLDSIIEFGANVGMNLKALRTLLPETTLVGIEINSDAHQELTKLIGNENAILDSIFEVSLDRKFDLTLIKGVLIHINPDMLDTVYNKLYELSSKYILVCEYYNPSPVTVNYRGHSDRLFKRDFAGEILDKFKDLKLVKYGFAYHRDPVFPQDDISWFLLEKK